MRVVILTGPPGAGKDTVAKALARSLERCAVVETDKLREMVISPYRKPWEGEEGKQQHRLGSQNASLIAKSFLEQGFAVVITDTISDNIAELYQRSLSSFQPLIIQLLPTFEEIKRRNKQKRTGLDEKEIAMAYEFQRGLTKYGVRIDNTSLSPNSTLEKIRRFLEEKRK